MKPKLLLGLSWASVALPLIAYILCSEVSTGQLLLHRPVGGRNVWLLSLVTFLISGIFGVTVLVKTIEFKRRWLFWLPLASLILTCLLFMRTGIFMGFYD